MLPIDMCNIILGWYNLSSIHKLDYTLCTSTHTHTIFMKGLQSIHEFDIHSTCVHHAWSGQLISAVLERCVLRSVKFMVCACRLNIRWNEWHAQTINFKLRNTQRSIAAEINCLCARLSVSWIIHELISWAVNFWRSCFYNKCFQHG